MGTKGDSDRFRFLTTDDIPLANKAKSIDDYELAPGSGNEWYLKCTAPSPARPDSEDYDFGPCTEFLAKAYFRHDASGIGDICVIFNGMDETPHNLREHHELFGFYDALGRSLADRGKLAILLPSPFHLNRSLPYKSKEVAEKRKKARGAKFADWTRPSNALTRHPQNLYRNHYQSFRELVSLCRDLAPSAFSPGTEHHLRKICPAEKSTLIARSTREFLRDRTAPQPRLSLIGYSMGGLRVMTAFCYAWGIAVQHNEEPLFSSCVAINSGGSFSGMNVPAWVNKKSWKNMVRRLNLDDFQAELDGDFKDELEEFKDYRKAIQDVTLGNALTITRLEEQDAGFTRRLLFTLGGSDDIMSMQSLQRITPPGGLNIFQVAGVGHMFRHGQWGTQLGAMLEHVSNFIDASSRDAERLDSKDIVDFLSLVDWHFKVLPYKAASAQSTPPSLEFDRAAEELKALHEEHPNNLLRIILFPAHAFLKWDADALDAKLAEVYSEEELSKLNQKAFDFIEYTLLRELRTRVEQGDCQPGLYRGARRSLLLGWLVSKNKALVDHWASMVEENGENRIGKILRDRGVVPEWLIDRSIGVQHSLLETVQAKMLRSFSLTCRRHAGMPELKENLRTVAST